jgi:hypothetical protein
MEYNMQHCISKDGREQENLGRRNHHNHTASWRIVTDKHADEQRISKSAFLSFDRYLSSSTSQTEDESSRSSTPNMASEPISCPPSPPEFDEDYQVPLEQSIEYYNSMTWCMYYRIMNARKANRNKKAHKKISSLSCLEATARTNQKQALSYDEFPAGNTNETTTRVTRRRPIMLNAQSADLATLVHRNATATGKQKANHVTVPRNDASIITGAQTGEEDIFHLDI